MSGKLSTKEATSIDCKTTPTSSKTSQAPDGGWGWVIVLSAFMMNVIVWGIEFTFGIFLGEIMETFEAERGAASVITSVQMGVTFCVGPFAADLIAAFGCRKTAAAGAVLAAAGIVTSSAASSIVVLTGTAGFLTGVGFGLINLPAVVVVSTYFEEKRAFAQGIAQAGAGIGTLLMAPTVNLLDDKLGWANTLVIIGALVLLCVPLAVLFRPLAADDSGQVRGRTGSYDINIPKDTLEKTNFNVDLLKASTNCLKFILAPICKIGKRYFDMFSDPIIMTYVLANSFVYIGFAVPYVYTVDRATQMGIDRSEASFLISVIGISSIVGKIALGYLSDRPCINRLYLYNLCIVVCGLSLGASNFCSTYATQVVYCAVFGLTSGAFNGLIGVILIDLTGLDKFTRAFGFQLLFIGAAIMIGPPIVGAFHDATGSHEIGFYFAGAIVIIPGAFLFLIPWIKHSQLRKKEEIMYRI